MSKIKNTKVTRKSSQPLGAQVIKIPQQKSQPAPLPQVPPFSLDFNFGTGTRTIVLPNGMDVLIVAKIFTDLLNKYGVAYQEKDAMHADFVSE